MTKNEVVTARIADISETGEGIGHVTGGPDDGFTVFVKDTVPGDLAEVKIIKPKKNYAYARLVRVVTPSPDRVEAACPIARQCGGCQLQEMSFQAQLAMKTEKVRRCLERIGHFEDAEALMEPIIAPEHPWRYRNKSLIPIAVGKDGKPVAGFFAGRTHSVIPCTDCLLGPEENKQILETILHWMEKNRVSAYDEEKNTGLVRNVLIRKGFATGEIMVCLVINGKRIPAAQALISGLECINGMTGIALCVNTKRTNVVMTDDVRTLWGQSYITDILRSEKYKTSVMYRISPNSFYQVNHDQAERLYEKVLDYAKLTGRETVMDLYCGTGTISLFLARHAKEVVGVEIVEQAVKDARANAERNGIGNASFYTGKAEEVVPRLYTEKHLHADVVVVDPPRKGCDEKLLKTILDMKPERVVYVSCNPATLARDLRILADGPFTLEKVTPCEQFSQTTHIESVTLLTRK